MLVRSADVLNQIYRSYYEKEREHFDRRVSLGNLGVKAMERIRLHQSTSVPMQCRTTYEYELRYAEECQILGRSEFARLGGRAPKIDSLQQVIVNILGQQPKITVQELLRRLRALPVGEIVEDITDGTITFYSNGRLKEAKVSGLKHRLTRARTAFQNESRSR
jgi:hypothetical protein